MADPVGIRELLESGVHFGHQTRRWNPKMRRFIHGERSGIYIVDLLKTQVLLTQAQEFSAQIAHRGGSVLFVGTKKSARDAVKDVAEAVGMPYVNHRWLGGLLTNFQTISQRIKRLHDLERYEADGQLALLPTRERLAAQADLEKLRANLGGVKDLKRPPEAMFVIDLNKEAIAVKEAQRLRIPVIGLVDTNCDPDGIDYIIPGNDDAIRSCFTITKALGDVIYEGRSAWVQSETERAEREAAEAARRQAEDQARKAAEEQARRDEQARREAAVQAANTAEGGGDRAVAEAQVAEAAQTIRETTQPAPHVAGHANDENAASADRRDQPSSAVAPTADGPQQDPASTPETPLTDVVEGGTPPNPANTETEAS